MCTVELGTCQETEARSSVLKYLATGLAGTAKLACKHGCCNSRIYHRLFFHHGRIRGFVCCVNTALHGPNLDAFYVFKRMSV